MLSSCSGGYGHKVVGGDFTVYYTAASDEQLATQIAHYWKEKNLISSQKQDLQLVKYEDGYELKLITNEPILNNEIPFEERRLLLELQKNLQNSIVKSPLEIVLCDSNFKPVYNINK